MRALAITLALVGAAASAAPAAAAPLPGASYSGGLIPTTYAVEDREGYAAVTVEVGADGRTMRLVANVNFFCGRRRGAVQQVVTSGAIGADGRFRRKARSRYYQYVFAGTKPRGRATVDLGFDGAAASGTLRFVTRSRGRRCARTLPVTLRVAGPDTSAPVPATPDLFLYGSADSLYRGVRTPFLIHVRPDATKIDLTLLGVPLRCGGPNLRTYTDYLVNYTPPTVIRPDGSFTKVERFSTGTRKSGGIVKTVVRINGRFTAQGATGTYSATARSRGLRCRTGRIAWSAVR